MQLAVRETLKRPNQETNTDKESDLADWNVLTSSFKTATAAC